MKKFISILLTLSFLFSAHAEVSYDLSQTNYTYDALQPEYSYDVSYPYQTYDLPEDASCNTRPYSPGECYYSCRSAACYGTALLLGVAVIAGLVAIVIHENHCAHSH